MEVLTSPSNVQIPLAQNGKRITKISQLRKPNLKLHIKKVHGQSPCYLRVNTLKFVHRR